MNEQQEHQAKIYLLHFQSVINRNIILEFFIILERTVDTWIKQVLTSYPFDAAAGKSRAVTRVTNSNTSERSG